MKKAIQLTLVASLMLAQATFAAEESKQESRKYSRDEVKYALMVVINSGALQFPKNQCPKVDEQLIEELRQEGLIKGSDAEPSTICTVISR